MEHILNSIHGIQIANRHVQSVMSIITAINQQSTEKATCQAKGVTKSKL